MEKLTLNLKGSGIFLVDSLEIDKKVSFIFGKNGTGKSTIASLLESQFKNFDFRCFQGFEGVVGEDNKLNAVILGKENNEIDKKIKEIEGIISDKQKEIIEKEKDTQKLSDNPNNLWSKFDDSKNLYEAQKKLMENFYKEAAKKIKTENDPQISSPNYNTNSFQQEINNAIKLTDDEIKRYEAQTKENAKNAKKIDYIEVDFQQLLKKTNDLLSKKVVQREVILEISSNNEKIRFAEMGLKLHNIGEICSFCGNYIEKERIEKLERYFSADEIDELKNEINQHNTILSDEIKKIEGINLEAKDFYPEYIDRINRIIFDFNKKRTEVLTSLQNLKKCSENKLKELFEESDEIKVEFHSLKKEILEYNEIVDENNDSNLKDKKEEAKKKLRFNKIKILLDEYNYDSKKEKLFQLEKDYEKNKEKLDEKKSEIELIESDIKELKNKIVTLQKETKNEKILADILNSKLKLYTNFELEYIGSEKEQGHYLVKCKITGNYRNITQLSSGEKNIIALLYFIQKLKEVDNPNNDLSKLIIFDDPMNSNDDTMQYLIIEELNRLINDLNKEDKIVIMTHNIHFYINMKYNHSYNKNLYIRLSSNGEKTEILKLTESSEDFKTSYEALWDEIKFLYKNSPSGNMLLNPIRRIIETYTKFNFLDKRKFLRHAPGAEKLFNVNSHSIDDLEADLNGKTKKDIIKMMKECFDKENFIDHFEKYFDINLDSKDE